MPFYDIIEAIKQYFSWDRVKVMFPEGRGIYNLFEFDLSQENVDKSVSFYGDQLIITDCDSQAYLKLNDPVNDSIDLAIVKQINSPFKQFYISNSAGSGNLKILAGRDGMFKTSSILPIDILKCNIGNLPMDINAQTIGNVGVDLKANSIGNIPIDIKANTLGNIPIDIKANTLGNIPIDIKANTLGNIDVDLKANSIGNIPIDIKANTIGNLPIDLKVNSIGNLDVDLNAQSIGNLDIDLNAQSVDRIVIRDHDGGVEAGGETQVLCNHGAETQIYSYSGTGTFRYCYFRTEDKTDAHFIIPRVYVDDTLLQPNLSFSAMNSWGIGNASRPLSLLKYSADNSNDCVYCFEKGIVFDTSIKFKVWNSSASQNIYVKAQYFYQKLS